MSNLSFSEFKSNRVRTVVNDGEVFFCLADVLVAMSSGTKVTDKISAYFGSSEDLA